MNEAIKRGINTENVITWSESNVPLRMQHFQSDKEETFGMNIQILKMIRLQVIKDERNNKV